MSDAVQAITSIQVPPNPAVDDTVRNMASLLADARDTGRMDPANLEAMRAYVADIVALANADPRVSPEVMENAARLLTEIDGWSAELSQNEPVVSGGETAGKSLGEIVESYAGSLSTPWGLPARWRPGSELQGIYRRMARRR